MLSDGSSLLVGHVLFASVRESLRKLMCCCCGGKLEYSAAVNMMRRGSSEGDCRKIWHESGSSRVKRNRMTGVAHEVFHGLVRAWATGSRVCRMPDVELPRG